MVPIMVHSTDHSLVRCPLTMVTLGLLPLPVLANSGKLSQNVGSFI